MIKLTRLFPTIAVLLVGCAGAALVLYAWQLPPFAGTVEITENAYVRGQVTVISPQLAGYVKFVAVQDYQTVKAGDLLVQIDDCIFAQKVRQAQATLAMQQSALANADQTRQSSETRIEATQAALTGARAALTTAQSEAHRNNFLAERGISSQRAAEQANLALDQARAALAQAEAAADVARHDLRSVIVNRNSLEAAVQNAEAALRLAEIDEQNTSITAPQDGKLGEIGVRLGQYVTAGTALASLVPPRKWVIANFKETQLYGLKIGQRASFTVDALRDARLTGHIQEFSPAAGSEFSVLKADNATGNFTKVAQRLSVRIAVDDGQPLRDQLAPGMSVVVSVDAAASPDTSVQISQR
jgi:multidrug resistance efflux pump